jgi:hypothetical protein
MRAAGKEDMLTILKMLKDAAILREEWKARKEREVADPNITDCMNVSLGEKEALLEE